MSRSYFEMYSVMTHNELRREATSVGQPSFLLAD